MSPKFFKTFLAGFLLLVSVLPAQIPDTIIVRPRLSTSPVISDADDPAIWRHPTDPAKSLIIGTDKGTYPDGGLFVWNLDGSQQQRINISRPNNVDVRYGLRLGNHVVDIAAVSMRDHRQVRIFKIDSATRTLSDVTTVDSTNVLNLMFKSPYGLTLYQRPDDRAIFAIVSSRHNESKDELWQIQLGDDGTGRVHGTLVRKFGVHRGIVEGMVADDELGFLYAAEENAGIHKYYADPSQGNARLALFETADSSASNVEGLALYKCSNGTGYLLISRPAAGCIKVYRREGENGDAHRHLLVATIHHAAGEAGDGIAVTPQAYGAAFPHGFLVWHNQARRNFQLYAWEEVAQKFLNICRHDETPAAVEMGAGDAGDQMPPFSLLQNYPNPFNPETAINFVVNKAGPVQLTVYNILGQEVRKLVNGTLRPGAYAARWDAKDSMGALMNSGIYFFQLRAERFSEARKIVLAR